jgi:hypothetical protein
MKRLDNNLDTLIRTSVDKITLDFNKDSAWEKLERKRAKTKMGYFSLAFAALIILGLLLIIPFKQSRMDNQIMSEFEKRQKLIEYENKISGTYIELLFCYDCSGDIIKSQIKQVPENQWILQIY